MRYVAAQQPESVEAYPLHWPASRPRAKYRKRADFHRLTAQSYRRPDGSTYSVQSRQKLCISDSRDRLLNELRKFGASKVIISSNLKLRLDGLPYSGQGETNDPGIAVYFTLSGSPHCLSCDIWDRAADNLAALSKHVEAMRGQLRWGAADIAQMFAGFKALPNAVVTPIRMTTDEAASFFVTYGGGSSEQILRDREQYNRAYKQAAKILHPDANGGNVDPKWNTLQEAAKLIEVYQAQG